MKDNGLFEMVFMLAGLLGLTYFFFKTGLPEAGYISLAFFLLFFLSTFIEVFPDRTEKK